MTAFDDIFPIGSKLGQHVIIIPIGSVVAHPSKIFPIRLKIPQSPRIIPIGMIKVVDNQTLGGWIRKERKAQGLTQAQLAGLCGVGTRFVHDLERGKASVHLGKALDVMHTLGIRLHLSGLSEHEST